MKYLLQQQYCLKVVLKTNILERSHINAIFPLCEFLYGVLNNFFYWMPSHIGYIAMTFSLCEFLYGVLKNFFYWMTRHIGYIAMTFSPVWVLIWSLKEHFLLSAFSIENGLLKTIYELTQGKKSLQCTQYDKAFNRKCYLKDLGTYHIGKKQLQCRQCDKASIAKLHQCAQCNKAFSQNSTLKSHLNTHTGDCIWGFTLERNHISVPIVTRLSHLILGYSTEYPLGLHKGIGIHCFYLYYFYICILEKNIPMYPL